MNANARRRVYCSGPLFCPEEVAAMTAIAEVLEEAGYETFLPHRDGLEPYVMRFVNDPRVTNRAFRRMNTFVSKAIFAVDLYQIVERCDRLVLNMNGRVPDEGGVVEAAVAFAAGKPLVLYKNDHRTKFNGQDNSMLAGLSYTFSTVSDLRKIPEELERVAARLEKHGPSPYRDAGIPANMRSVVDFGRRVWTFLAAANHFQATSDDEVLERMKAIVKMTRETFTPKDPGWL